MAELPHLVVDRLHSCCEAECSFSCLGRVKTYLRNRMGEDWLSGLTMKNMNHNMEIDLESPQIRCASIITMENATCSGACCLIINRSADEQHLLKHS